MPNNIHPDLPNGEADTDCDERFPPVRKRTRPRPPENEGAATPVPEQDLSSPSSPDGDAAAPYEVGYGKPPKQHRFKPGQSGNPKGRPKDAKGLNTIVRDTMTTQIPVRTADGPIKMSRIQALVMRRFERAMVDSEAAAALLFSHYKAAVPDIQAEAASRAPEPSSAADLAILEAYEAEVLARANAAPEASEEEGEE